MPVTTARQKVLAYLRKQRVASAAQVGHALNMSAANVRHHLSVLLSDGRIAAVNEIKKAGRGRPVKLYRVSENLLGNNLVLLSDKLLEKWLDKLSPSEREEALHALASELLRQVGQSNPDVPVTKRLAFLVERLNELHYQARWEAGAEGPRILFGHCPYAVIVGKHPELCQMDRFLLGDEMGGNASQLAKINPDPGGPHNCIFRF